MKTLIVLLALSCLCLISGVMLVAFGMTTYHVASGALTIGLSGASIFMALEAIEVERERGRWHR